MDLKNSKSKAHPSDFKQYIMFMAKYAKSYKLALTALIFAILTFIVAGRLIPIIFGWAVDYGINKKDLHIIYLYAGLLLFCNLIRTLVSFSVTYGFRNLGQKILFRIRKDLIAHVQKLPISYFDKTSSGRIVTRVANDTRSLGDLFSEGLSGIFINFIEVFSIIVSLIWISWPLALLVIVILPPVLWASYVLSEKIRNKYIFIKSKLSSINSYSAESLDGVQVLQLYGGEDFTTKHFGAEVEDYKNLQLDAHKLFATLWPLLEFFKVSCIIISLIAGLYLMKHSLITIGLLSSFILLLQGFFRPLRFILERYNQVQNGVTSSQRIIRLLKEVDEEESFLNLKDHKKNQLRQQSSYSNLIQAKNLSFSYDGKKQVLKDLNFKIQAGQQVAIVGRTGSGKTTLVSLLQKFYKTQDKSLFLKDQDINTLDLKSLRQSIMVLRQEEFLFKGDVRSNIALGNLHASEEQIENIRQKVQLKYKLDALVDEMGANLSSGEKQLVALARVLLFDPELIVLDEATSHIDSISEKKVLAAMSEVLKGRTSIIIAHRLSTVMQSDLILVLKEGELIEQGHPKDLLKFSSHFKSFFSELL